MKPGGLHLQRHEAEHAVVEDHDLHRQLHLRQRDEVAHQHGEAAVARHRDHLTARAARPGRRWRAAWHWPSSRAPGADQAPASVHREIARRPDRRRADVEGEHRVVRRCLAQEPRQILRVDRLVPGRARAPARRGRRGPSCSGRGCRRDAYGPVFAVRAAAAAPRSWRRRHRRGRDRACSDGRDSPAGCRPGRSSASVGRNCL